MADESIPPTNPQPVEGQSSIDAPAFNKAETELKLEAKSVKNVEDAYRLCKALEYDNQQRAMRAADMQALHDGAPPNSAAGKMAKAQSWQANTSTLWMAGIVGRVSQRLINAIISQTYCTASTLPSGYTDWKTKSDLLREKFTAFVRGYDGNTGFINATIVETVLQGYAFAVFLDPTTPYPTFFKQDELFVPIKSTQHARELQFFAARRDFRLDKFIELFVDENAAETVGYDVQNCMEAANRAMVLDPRDSASTTQPRKFVDLIDEGAIGLSGSTAGERIVRTWLLFNREYDGSVSFWLIDRDNGKKLRFSFKLFKRMQDVLTIFSFEAGNGTVHSSKGLGRKLASLAVMKELFRCGVIDNARMAGLTMLYVSGADKTKKLCEIAAPFLYVDSSAKVAEHQFEISAEAYAVVDQMIDAWAEQAVGAWLPVQINDKGKTERTATEATIDARRENEASDIMIRRCLDQDATRIQMQQLRVCSDENVKKARRLMEKLETDPEAEYPSDTDEANLMRFLVESMQSGLTDEEIQTWSKSQASAFAHVTEGAVQRGVAAAKQLFTGNPNINQSALDYAALEGLVGAEKAKELFVPTAESTNKIEAERKQQDETSMMALTGLPIQVSPRDNHMLEIPVVLSFLQNVAAPALSNAATMEKMLKTAELNLNHMGQHLEAAAALGQNKLPQFADFDKFYQGFKKQLGDVVQIQEETRVAQEQVAQGIRQEQGAVVPMTPDVPGDFQEQPTVEQPLLATAS